MTAVEICPICDIAGCRHVRESKAKMTHQTDEELDALVVRLHGTPLYEGHGEASETPERAADAITAIRTQLSEVKAELGNANKIMDDWTTLHRVIADIRDASGLGSRPMLSDLAAEIGRSLAAANARADRAEAALAALAAKGGQ